MSLLAFLAFGVFARRAIARAFEMNIPLPARAAATKHKLLSIPQKIDNWFNFESRISNFGLVRTRPGALDVGRWTFSAFFILHPSSLILPNNRSHRHLHDLGRRRSTIHLFPHPVAAIFRSDDRLIKKTREIIDVRIGAPNNIAAAATIAAIRSAFRHKLLPPKTHTTTPAIAGLCKDFDPIDKHDEALKR